jgi:hypothetical protein
LLAYIRTPEHKGNIFCRSRRLKEALMKWSLLACCLALCGCGDQANTMNNAMTPPQGNATDDSNFIAELSGNMGSTDANGFVPSSYYPSPAAQELAAGRKRDEEAIAREDRWRERVLPTPRNAFPKIGTCYASRIREIVMEHGQVGDAMKPFAPGDEGGAQYDQKWTWEKYPIRDHGRIAIPYNGLISYTNGLRQSFDHGIWRKQEPPAFAHARVGDRVEMCVVELPSRCPPGDFRGIVYRTRDLRTGGVWEESDSQHDCGGQ